MRNEALIEYGHRLLKAGFTVWVPRGPGWQHIVYQREVRGRLCEGTVQREDTLTACYQHLMPIRPSIEGGSAMHVDAVPITSTLTVRDALKIASPHNRNKVVGWRENHPREGRRDRSYYLLGEEEGGRA